MQTVPPISHYRRPSGAIETGSSRRIIFLLMVAGLFFVIIVYRLFQLQIVRHNEYAAIAKAQHFGAITLPARRGEILARDTHSGEFSKLATNTTLDLVYVDPLIAEDKVMIAKKLAPLLFTRADYDLCVLAPEKCAYDIKKRPESGNDLDDPLGSSPAYELQTPWIIDPKAGVKNSVRSSMLKDYPRMVDELAARILRKISKSEVDYVILKNDTDPNLMADVINEHLTGVFADVQLFRIYADPTLIPEGHASQVAKSLSLILGESQASLEKSLSRKPVRYVFLKNKIDPEISQKIEKLNLKGVVLIPEHWRFYPEGGLGAAVIGFLNHDEIGQYGIEGYFNTELKGKKGSIIAKKDPMGRQITVGDSEIVEAVDGDTVVLTIDRIIQKKVEEVMAAAVEIFRADSGQAIVMDPFTGAILAMANYPSFNPNDYTASFILRPLEKDEKMENTVPQFKLDERRKYVAVTEEEKKNPEIRKYIFENKLGPGVFKNKVVSEVYEPGSVFKPLVMAAALDAKEVEPQTTFFDDGPLRIDDFVIKNSTNSYYGKTTMTRVLELSLNTGMSWVAKKLDKQLMYKYLKDFGFGEYTNIFLEGETKGRLDYYKQWSKAQLLTQSFGQGIATTPLQMIAAWAVLANGGKLVQPYIVDSIERNGVTMRTEPQTIRRVISEETSSIITSMLVSAVQNGYGHKAHVPGYLIAGKTGTSQIAGPSGKYETGEGATITSFAGYPASQPRFIMLIKFDRPRIGENTWGENTAAPVFREIAEFLLDYYRIPAQANVPNSAPGPNRR